MTSRYARQAPLTQAQTDALYAPADPIYQGSIDALDADASAFERKWGIGRLRLIVGDILRTKFDAQRVKLDRALQADDSDAIVTHADAMRRAWAALDKAATDARQVPLAPEVWECLLPSTGELVAIVRTEAEAHHATHHQRTYTLAEIATLLDGLPDAVHALKAMFPGAKVVEVRKTADDFDWKRGDEIPF